MAHRVPERDLESFARRRHDRIHAPLERWGAERNRTEFGHLGPLVHIAVPRVFEEPGGRRWRVPGHGDGIAPQREFTRRDPRPGVRVEDRVLLTEEARERPQIVGLRLDVRAHAFHRPPGGSFDGRRIEFEGSAASAPDACLDEDGLAGDEDIVPRSELHAHAGHREDRSRQEPGPAVEFTAEFALRLAVCHGSEPLQAPERLGEEGEGGSRPRRVQRAARVGERVPVCTKVRAGRFAEVRGETRQGRVYPRQQRIRRRAPDP